ncbi:2-oxo-4-hydroxy-4-carboxy-5-ureidoimidazoline decarboxylase [Demequina lutea]|uniref:2-oxo-4-hydroxy-4-carboxy-5-ureidoimidazoline decarboxylase n=1 Tax=Demequina lutea TaxID=431489 RepID=A0A7Y9ZC21_9MICO|nr:2-oxo-4-hydroxy-4-carboxy-5-ureidoimidazoline decarboxylase [Demequina lutea]NYI42110.1 2-oxo-4-hydroxy-4-carboxy-5-ureidoimidazoline decarboxylase [Demequina lutea]
MVKPDRESLLTCLRVERWADALAGHPFDTMLGLERSAVAAATPLTEAEVDEALVGVPRMSESLLAVEAPVDADLNRRGKLGLAAYEERYGRVFAIRADGRSVEQIVAELERRLENSPAAELAEVADQLRGIALVRLRELYAAEFAAA